MLFQFIMYGDSDTVEPDVNALHDIYFWGEQKNLKNFLSEFENC